MTATPAGQVATNRAADLLPGLPAQVVLLPAGCDPADLLTAHGPRGCAAPWPRPARSWMWRWSTGSIGGRGMPVTRWLWSRPSTRSPR